MSISNHNSNTFTFNSFHVYYVYFCVMFLLLFLMCFNIKTLLNAPLLFSYPCVTFNKLNCDVDDDDDDGDNNFVVIVDPAEFEVFNFNVIPLSVSLLV